MTEVLVDSNILISALIFPNGAVSEALRLAIRTHYIAFTDTIIIEFKRVISIKWPDKTREIEPFLADFQYRLLPPSDYSQVLMRDPDDQPNLNAAMAEDVDIILTGDADYSVLEIERPRIMTARQYLTQFAGQR